MLLWFQPQQAFSASPPLEKHLISFAVLALPSCACQPCSTFPAGLPILRLCHEAETPLQAAGILVGTRECGKERSWPMSRRRCCCCLWLGLGLLVRIWIKLLLVAHLTAHVPEPREGKGGCAEGREGRMCMHCLGPPCSPAQRHPNWPFCRLQNLAILQPGLRALLGTCTMGLPSLVYTHV